MRKSSAVRTLLCAALLSVPLAQAALAAQQQPASVVNQAASASFGAGSGGAYNAPQPSVGD